MQRKIVENDVLIKLSEQGLSGKEIAKRTSISPAAVSTRLARIRLQQHGPPESFSRLTVLVLALAGVCSSQNLEPLMLLALHPYSQHCANGKTGIRVCPRINKC